MAHLTNPSNQPAKPTRPYPRCPVPTDADHNFNVRACDWGFREFVTLNELKDGAAGYMMDDKLMVSAKVRVEPQVSRAVVV